MTHQLTDEQRKLLEDCGQDNLRATLSYSSEGVQLIDMPTGGVHSFTSHCTRGAFFPRAAVEAWLAEQDAKEAEIERRIAGAISIKSEVAYFNDWEAVTEKFFVSEDFLFYRKELAAPTSAIPVPRERIRAALDAKRAREADHLRDATKMVQPDQTGDATEMIEPRRYPDEVGEDQLPWFADNSWGGFWTTTKRCAFSADIANSFRVSEWGNSLAKIKAEQAAEELNAIWRREEEARRRDIAHGEALEEDKRRSVTISPEVRARLESEWKWAVEHFILCRSLNTDPCQARAFLRERGIEVEP